MKTALVMMISIAGFAFGADPKTNVSSEPQAGEPQASELRRLDSVTWDLNTHTLSWVVQKGKEENGEFVATGAERYQVTPDTAKMQVAAEKRAIEEDEAAVLHRLLDALSIYCAQSVVWWDHGEGTLPASPGTPSLKPDRPAKQDEEIKDKPAPTKPVKALPLGVAEVAGHPQK